MAKSSYATGEKLTLLVAVHRLGEAAGLHLVHLGKLFQLRLPAGVHPHDHSERSTSRVSGSLTMSTIQWLPCVPATLGVGPDGLSRLQARLSARLHQLRSLRDLGLGWPPRRGQVPPWRRRTTARRGQIARRWRPAARRRQVAWRRCSATGRGEIVSAWARGAPPARRRQVAWGRRSPAGRRQVAWGRRAAAGRRQVARRWCAAAGRRQVARRWRAAPRW